MHGNILQTHQSDSAAPGGLGCTCRGAAPVDGACCSGMLYAVARKKLDAASQHQASVSVDPCGNQATRQYGVQETQFKICFSSPMTFFMFRSLASVTA